MGDSTPEILALHELKYPIDQYSSLLISKLSRVFLKREELDIIPQTLMGHVIKLAEREVKFSAKMVYVILSRSLKKVKKNEAWFHFGAQPLRFSPIEFHMITGLKCSGEEDTGMQVIGIEGQVQYK